MRRRDDRGGGVVDIVSTTLTFLLFQLWKASRFLLVLWTLVFGGFFFSIELRAVTAPWRWYQQCQGAGSRIKTLSGYGEETFWIFQRKCRWGFSRIRHLQSYLTWRVNRQYSAFRPCLWLAVTQKCVVYFGRRLAASELSEKVGDDPREMIENVFFCLRSSSKWVEVTTGATFVAAVMILFKVETNTFTITEWIHRTALLWLWIVLQANLKVTKKLSIDIVSFWSKKFAVVYN